MSLTKIIDVVLLPDANTSQELIRISDLVNAPDIRLNDHGQLPHISLLMGVTQESGLERIITKFKLIVAGLSLSDISLDKFIIKPSYTGLHTSSIPDELSQLQDKLINDLASLWSYDAKVNYFKGYPAIAEISTKWVSGFLVNSTGDNFSPHVTLGNAQLQDKNSIKLPVTFKPKSIALVHLGNYCTCAEVLLEVRL